MIGNEILIGVVFGIAFGIIFMVLLGCMSGQSINEKILNKLDSLQFRLDGVCNGD